jgi:2'-5' RNA ligase
MGSFERRGQAATLWIGLAPQEPLKGLHQKVDQACVRAGLDPERRTYHPHITLARLGRSAEPVEAAIARSGGAVSAPFLVESFGLYESFLTPEGAVYSLVERYLPAES